MELIEAIWRLVKRLIDPLCLPTEVCYSVVVMKRAANRRSRAKRDSGVDEGQIIEALRLTPTERLEKAWRYSEFALDRVLRSLVENRVAFVIVGATAAIAQGAPLGTEDLDICYLRTHDNADRLAAALKPFRPRLRGAPEDLAFKLDGKTIMMGSNFTFITDAGDVDILGYISGVGEYPEMRKSAVETEAFGLRLLMMSLENVIKSKKAAGRNKDKAQLPVLEETLRLRAKDL